MIFLGQVMRMAGAFFALHLAGSLAHATPQNWPTQAFEPTLVANHNPSLCVPVLEQVISLRNSNHFFVLRHLNLAKALPNAEIITLPEANEHIQARRGRGGLYNRTEAIAGDWNNDGEPDRLIIRGIDRGWRYLSVRADIDTTGRQDFETSLMGDRERQPLMTWGPVESVTLISMAKQTYTLSWKTERRGQREILYVVPLPSQPETDPQPECAITVRPEPKTYKPLLKTDSFIAGLVDLYGGDGMGGGGVKSLCDGSLGWTAPPLTKHFDILFNRPHRFGAYTKNPYGSSSDQLDAMREARVLKWAVKDPRSWQDYRALKAARPDFVKRLQNHYRTTLLMSDEDARLFSEQGWRYLLDAVVYARNPDSWMKPDIGKDDFLTAKPADTPEAVASKLLAYEARTSELSDSAERYYQEAIMMNTALRAGLYAKLKLPALSELADRRDHLVETRAISKREEETAEIKRAAALQIERDGDFIAALGSIQHMQWALDRGATPDAITPGFGKTALMYAAQNNDLNTVRYLIDAGANINAMTQAQDACLNLTYDSRSALTYGAENGDLDLVQYLIKSGADTAHTDSKGRTLRDYLDLNTKLTQRERQKVEELLAL